MSGDTACCAHLKVEYRPIKNDDGSMTERWTCTTCCMTFVPSTRYQQVVKNRDQIAVTNAELGLLLVEQLDVKARLQAIYELLLGDTDGSPWHSDHCYHRSGAHHDPDLCTCGLTLARAKLRELYEELPMPTLDDVLEERRAEREKDSKQYLGDPGVRDPDAPCDVFKPGRPNGDCASDGHYLCDECEERMPYLPERDGETCSYCDEDATQVIETAAGLLPACDFHAQDPTRLNDKQAGRFVELATSAAELREKETVVPLAPPDNEKVMLTDVKVTSVSMVEEGGHPFKIVKPTCEHPGCDAEAQQVGWIANDRAHLCNEHFGMYSLPQDPGEDG